jgi:hypothetical protein
MSIGNLKDYGNKGNNFPWQLKMLQGQQCACDALQEIVDNTDQVEPLLVQILAAIQNGTDFEAFLVVDANEVTWLEVRIWNPATGTFDPPVYFAVGSNTPGTPVAPISYINPNTYLAQIVSNTANLISIEAGTPDALGQTTMANSMPVTIASDQTALPVTDNGGSITVDGTVAATQSGTWNLNNITGTVSLPTGASTELTLAALLAAFNLEDFATETTLATVAADLALIYTNLQLNTISVANIDTKLTAAARTPNILSTTGSGSTPAGVYSFSIANVGSAAGSVDTQTLPAGVTINFDGGAMNNTLGAMSFDATGTTFVVTWIS